MFASSSSLFGLFSRSKPINATATASSSTSRMTDIEAQHHLASLPSLPSQVYISATTTTSTVVEDCTDAIDDFFGVTHPKPTRASRHDDPILTRVPTITKNEEEKEDYSDIIDDFFGVVPSKHTSEEEEEQIPAQQILPPPYNRDLESGSASLPSYSEAAASAGSFEPYTIPEAFFKWGFFFPLFWFLGSLLLINFHSPTELTAWYSVEESAERVRILRTAERRWAKRCALASIILLFVALVVTGMTFGIMMSLKN